MNDKKLYKGVFWIKDLENIESSIICYKISCDIDGNILDNDISNKEIFGKSGNTINHKKLWETLSSKVTNNKEFDYYPRGRVEINNGKVKIFISQYMINYKDKILSIIKEEFNLNIENGINNISVFADGSEHYKPKMFIDK